VETNYVVISHSIPRCEHLKINRTQCGSPALQRSHFCYFHQRWQETRIVLNANPARRGRAALDLPVLEDANSIQVSLMQVMRLILSGQLDPQHRRSAPLRPADRFLEPDPNQFRARHQNLRSH
jgi:hypothetical protein